MEAQLKLTDEVTGNTEQLKVQFNHGIISSGEGSPIQLALESVEHVNKAELKYFVLHEDVQSVSYKDDVYIQGGLQTSQDQKDNDGFVES